MASNCSAEFCVCCDRASNVDAWGHARLYIVNDIKTYARSNDHTSPCSLFNIHWSWLFSLHIWSWWYATGCGCCESGIDVLHIRHRFEFPGCMSHLTTSIHSEWHIIANCANCTVVECYYCMYWWIVHDLTFSYCYSFHKWWVSWSSVPKL